MGMSIDEITQGIEVIKAQAEWECPMDWQIVLDNAKGIMCKYQKIEQMVKKWNSGESWEEEVLLDCEFIERLSDIVLGEVEDGNDNN